MLDNLISVAGSLRGGATCHGFHLPPAASSMCKRPKDHRGHQKGGLRDDVARVLPMADGRCCRQRRCR
eukprot:3239404-Prymnesium_polylepis.1